MASHIARVDAASSWIDRWRGARDRLLASPRFRRWAAAFPPTRPIARRRTRALFDLSAGFVYSQILLACIQLRLFDLLAEGPQTVAALARRLALPAAAAARLLEAAASLRLVARRGRGRFGLGPLGAALVGNPGVAAMVEHHRFLYADLADPVALLRGARRDTALAGYWPYAGADRPASLAADQVAAYTALMAASQTLIAEQVLDAYALDRHRCLLDVGGGDGAFLAAAAARAPQLRLVLLDLPPVAPARARPIRSAGARRPGHGRGRRLPARPSARGADLVTLVRVIHDHDDDAALAILRASRRALPEDGTLLLAEPMAGTPGAEPIAAYFGFYLLAMGSGRPAPPTSWRRCCGPPGSAPSDQSPPIRHS